MARRKRKKSDPAARLRAFIWLGLAAVLLFGLGQLYLVASSDRGAMFMARQFGLGDEHRIADILERRITEALATIGADPDSIHMSALAEGRPGARVRAALPVGASLIQANHAVSHAVEEAGGAVLAGRERPGEALGERRVVLVVGIGERPTHEVVLLGASAEEREAEPEPARLAIVIYGLGDDADNAQPLIELDAPFAVAIVPGARWSGSLYRAARDRKREIVVNVPMEPLNYPSVNPGPDAILVTMNASRIGGLLRKHLGQAGEATAVANHMGSLATQDVTVMTAFMKELKRRELPFIHVNPVAGAVCRDLAADMGVAYEEPTAILDPSRFESPKALHARWREVIADTRARGRGMIWIRASKTTLDWLPEALQAKALDGVSLVPLTAVIRGPVTT